MIYHRVHFKAAYRHILYSLLKGHSTSLWGCIIVYSTIYYAWIFDLRFESFSIENSSAVNSCFGTFAMSTYLRQDANIIWLDIANSPP